MRCVQKKASNVGLELPTVGGSVCVTVGGSVCVCMCVTVGGSVCVGMCMQLCRGSNVLKSLSLIKSLWNSP